MARRSTKKADVTAPTAITRFDEANVGRLGLISIQERIPDNFTSWHVDFFVEGRPAQLSCESLPKYGGVPHGLDGDIANAIILIYHEHGSPADGVIRTTPYQLLKRAGLDASGRYYKSLKLSLLRLRTSTYFASEAWREHPRGNWTTVTFNYLEGLEFTTQSDEQDLSSGSAILIRLAKPIVKSIRAEYVKPLDIDFLTSLTRPLTRALYRLLDARRYNPLHPSEVAFEYSVNVSDWGEACKIVDQRPNKIRATLQGAHEDLIERGYLKSADYTGRGKKQVISYVFARPVDAELMRPVIPAVQCLLDQGISLKAAWRYVDEFGEERVLSRFERFNRLMARGYQANSRSGLLVDIIRDDAGKYNDDGASPLPRQPTPERKASQMPTLLDLPDQALSLEERVERAMKTIQFLMRDRLSTREYAILRACLIVGQPDADFAAATVSAAKANNSLDQVADELLNYIQHYKPA